MDRLTITQAAARLGVSVDTIRRRVRKGELNANRDNKGQWWLELADDVQPEPPMPTIAERLAPAMVAPALQPMQMLDAALADALRAQVTDLAARLDRAEVGRELDRATAERQGRELIAAQLRATIAESDVRAMRELADAREASLRELLEEARRPVWQRWLGWHRPSK